MKVSGYDCYGDGYLAGEKTQKGENAMDKQVLKLGARVLENLPEMSPKIIQLWINDPKGLQEVLQEAFSQFNTWKTIQLGTHKNATKLIGAMDDEGLKISDQIREIMGMPEFTIATEITDIQLVKVSVAKIGFFEGATREVIYERIQQLGLSFVPAEAGPQLRRQYRNQPKGEKLLIGIKPVIAFDGRFYVFSVIHIDDKLWLLISHGSPSDYYYGDAEWVFTFRK